MMVLGRPGVYGNPADWQSFTKDILQVRIKHDEVCIKNDEYCIKNAENCIENDELHRFS